MDYNTTIDRMNAKLSLLDIPKVKQVVAGLYEKTEEGSDLAFEVALQFLENITPSDEFVQFCDDLIAD